MKNVINQRIREIIALKNSNDREFASSIGVPQNTLSQIFTRGNYPKSDLVISILNTYPEISAEWLMRGEGTMMKADKNHNFVMSEPDIVYGSKEEKTLQEMLSFLQERYKELDRRNSQLLNLVEKFSNCNK